VQQLDLDRPAGGVLHAYDTGPTGRPDEVAVFWHGGTPNTGEPPAPLLAAADGLGLRFLGADRPGYGGTTRDPAATVGDVVPDVLAVADARGVDRFAVLGHSGGGPRVLACAALAPERLLAAVAISSPAPPDAAGLDRYAGMAAGIVREQRAAAQGRAALMAVLEHDEFDEDAFTAGDGAALAGPWGWLGANVGLAVSQGLDAEADDLLAAAAPWGVDLRAVRDGLLLVHGEADRMVPASHSAWLHEHVPGSDLRLVAGAGHIDVLTEVRPVLEALRRRALAR
jgi:pimeloyl-ACP methyl ester carboxylesterase